MQFIDTNILVYSVSDAPGEMRKRTMALEILQDQDCALSVQVLQEFYVQVTRQSRPRPLPHELAVELIETWLRFPVIDVTPSILRHALALRQRFQFHYWDCAVLAAAHAGGCDTLLTEDLTHGQSIEGVRIANPFR